MRTNTISIFKDPGIAKHHPILMTGVLLFQLTSPLPQRIMFVRCINNCSMKELDSSNLTSNSTYILLTML